MSKKMFKRLSILLSLLMAISLLAPLAALAEENTDVIYTPMAIVDVERFTIGQGFYHEPIAVELKEGDTAYDLLADLVGNENLMGDSSYVTGIKGTDQGPESLVIPDYIVDVLGGPDTEAAKANGNPLEEDALGQDSYSSQAGWTYIVNNQAPSVGMGNYIVQANDVIRFAFTYWGYGADVTGISWESPEPLVVMADKDELLTIMGTMNLENERFYFNSPIVKAAYDEALVVVENPIASQEEVDAAENALLAAMNGYEIVAQYKTHIENKGWEKDWVIDNNMSGTSGKSLRLEGIYIEMQENEAYDVGVQYKTHIENEGWEETSAKDGDLSGTQGKALRLEAIEIELTGADANLFDVYYQVHAQNVGWMNLAKNGGRAGTAGFGRRLEGIRIQVVPKDMTPTVLSEPDVTDAFIDKNAV